MIRQSDVRFKLVRIGAIQSKILIFSLVENVHDFSTVILEVSINECYLYQKKEGNLACFHVFGKWILRRVLMILELNWNYFHTCDFCRDNTKSGALERMIPDLISHLYLCVE